MRTCALILLVVGLIFAPQAAGYAVLTHEAIIDAVWDQQLKPMLEQRFPNATPEELKKAHAYAYGGAIIQDMGYYPFGSKFFSDVTHYVRSGDFIAALIRDSQDLNEYAFALGSLAHYAADNEGHPIAVNRAVPISYPDLALKYGDSVTYAENPGAHIKTEFGFDVLQVARGLYAPESYHDFIGFEVSKPVLERAFRDTYDLEMNDVFASVDLAIGTYRRAVGSVIPEMTKVAWNLKKDEIVRLKPGITKQKFLFNLSRASYEKEWDGKYEKPGIFARILSFVFRVVPKVGPFRAVAFKPPTSLTEQYFMESFNRTLDLYRKLLNDARADRLALQNTDFDTGRATAPGEYRLADNAYAKLVRKLADHEFGGVSPELQRNILAFYRNPTAPNAAKTKPKEWAKTVAAVNALKEQASADRAITQ